MEHLPIVTGVISSPPLEAIWKLLHFQLILSLVDKFSKFCLVDFLEKKKTKNEIFLDPKNGLPPVL